MKAVNLTPHPINLYGRNDILDGPQRTIPPSGVVARIATIELGNYNGGGFNTPPLLFTYVEYGRLENLPAKEDGTYLIVSLAAALAVRGRDDILAPYEEVRNESGTVIGCRYLQKVC